MARSRAADDFQTIRARMEELRRERAHAPADDSTRSPEGPRPYAISERPGADRSSGISPIMRRALQRVIPVPGRRASFST